MSADFWRVLARDSAALAEECTGDEGDDSLSPAVRGRAWVVGPAVTEQPPSLNDEPDDLARRVLIYPDWTPGTTMVVSGPLPQGKGPGRRFRSFREAREWAAGRFGGVIQEIRDAARGGRWALRVRRPVQTKTEAG